MHRNTFSSYRRESLLQIREKFVPYAELIRINKPLAILLFYFPCLWGTLLAASVSRSPVPRSKLLNINAIFIVGSTLVRSAGCTWNDVVDAPMDRQVARTRQRPVARGAVSQRSGTLFMIVQVIFGLTLVRLLLPPITIHYAVPSMLLTGLYPYGKRFTFYPQAILGPVASYGTILAFIALDIDLWQERHVYLPALTLFASGVAWTFVYDTVYAAQDLKDDLKAGIKTPVVRHLEKTRFVLIVAAFLQVFLLFLTGIAMSAGANFYILACLMTAVIHGCLISQVDLASPESCVYWFKANIKHVSSMVTLGFLAEYLNARL